MSLLEELFNQRRDFFGNRLAVGDDVAFIQRAATPPVIGTIIKMSPKMLHVEITSVQYWADSSGRTVQHLLSTVKVYPNRVFKCPNQETKK
jgi:hypothetical protein